MSAAAEQQMPKGIPYIIVNEFAERFCFYGINSILAIYMVQFLHFTDANAATWQSLFKSGAYFFPLVGAIVSDVFWAKFRTIITFSAFYVAGCFVLAFTETATGMAVGMFLVAFGTGGIKPCVSTNVGDQFTAKNAHLIERAFSWFYLAINAGSSISIFLCPILLQKPEYGPRLAFGVPGVMMTLATIAFWLGRNKFAVVPPAMTQGRGRGLALFAAGIVPVLAISMFAYTRGGPLGALLSLIVLLSLLVVLCLRTPLRGALPRELTGWLEQSFTGEGLRIVGRLLVVYFFVAMFWMLWDQSNGNTWTLQAQSSLMDKHLGFGITLLPAQLQVVNGLLILMLVPIFTYGIYPLLGRFFPVTPLRRIGIGLFTVASSFLIVAWIENEIQDGHPVSMWWQILAYVVLTASEVLVSITALEYSYKQAPLRMKSFIMALFLLSTSVGNILIAAVNQAMIKPLEATAIETGADTWVRLKDASGFVTGQKIDFTGESGIRVTTASENGAAPNSGPLQGTFLVAEIDAAAQRLRLMDVVNRQSVASTGEYKDTAQVSTYYLVGPNYFYFFVAVMAVMGVIYVFVAMWVKEKTYVRADEGGAA
ncbi:MAG TPA: oligopeptide:H+ symporter [Candidatus Binatia bacterium]|nr:oligopeptide:H+ symporter [Candidatus Binatia bacterium]